MIGFSMMRGKFRKCTPLFFMLREKVKVFAEKLHEKIFHHAMSDEMKLFLENLSFSFFLGVLTSGLLFVTNISAGRILGPAGYGEYNYFLSLATSSTFFFLLGNNSSGTRFVSDQKYKEKREALLSASIFLTLIQAAVFFVFVYAFRGFLGDKLDLSDSSILLIFFFGLIFSFRELFDSFLRALGFFKRQSAMKFLDSIFVILAFFSFYFLSRKTFTYLYYVASLMAGATIFIVAALYSLRKRLVFFTWDDVVLLLHYNKFLIIAGVSGLILSSDKVFIGKYIGNAELGVYSAYYTSSQTVISTIAIVFMNIFWPVVIRNKENLKPIVKKLEIAFYRYFILWFILNVLSGSTFLLFFGNEYPFQLILMLLFSLASLLNIIFFVFMGILNIDQIGRATFINLVIYSFMVSSIILFRSVYAYLIAQILIYVLAAIYVRKMIHVNICKNV